MTKLYDTCALLALQEKVFDDEKKFLISSTTLNELENIKTSFNKDNDIKWTARKLIRLLSENEDKYEIILYNPLWNEDIASYNLPMTKDSEIIITAKMMLLTIPDLVFITQDLCCKKLADCINIPTEFIDFSNDDEYKGYVEITMDDNELNRFYSDYVQSNINYYNLLINQYLLIVYNGEIIDKYKWTEEGYKKVEYKTIESKMFGKLKPKDVYQECALDSLYSNQLTVLRGPAGSGKSYIALSYLMSLLDKGEIDRIIIFANTVAVRGAAKLGYYPGSRLEKLLDSQIGNFLVAKFGSITEVERMTEDGTLMILPCSDIRGLDLSSGKIGCYVTEAQNATIDMMKLMLQRVGDESIVILDGDSNSQVDLSEYGGSNNGLKRASQIFRGQNFYGETTLDKIYRSRIAAQAELM